MKGLFITVFVVFFSFCTVRFIYGIDSFSFAYSFEYLSAKLPNIKEDFSALILLLQDISELVNSSYEPFSFPNIGYVVGLSDVFSVLSTILKVIFYLSQIPYAILNGVGFLFIDFFQFFQAIYYLLFMPGIV